MNVATITALKDLVTLAQEIAVNHPVPLAVPAAAAQLALQINSYTFVN